MTAEPIAHITAASAPMCSAADVTPVRVAVGAAVSRGADMMTAMAMKVRDTLPALTVWARPRRQLDVRIGRTIGVARPSLRVEIPSVMAMGTLGDVLTGRAATATRSAPTPPPREPCHELLLSLGAQAVPLSRTRLLVRKQQ